MKVWHHTFCMKVVCREFSWQMNSGSFNFPSTYLMPIKKIKINAESTPGMTLEMWETVQVSLPDSYVGEYLFQGEYFSSVQYLSHVRLFATPWTAAYQASLSITNSRRLLKLMSNESVMPSNHLILCRPLLLLSSLFPSIRVFSSESALRIRWSKYWSFSFSVVLPVNTRTALFQDGLVGSPCIMATVMTYFSHQEHSHCWAQPPLCFP